LSIINLHKADKTSAGRPTVRLKWSAVSDKDAVRVAGQELLDRIADVMQRVDWASFLELADMLPRARRTFVTGAGRSGLVARSFGMRLMHAGLPAFVPGETITPAAGEGDLLVAISCTGQTGITDYVARRARQLGAKVVVLTAEPASPLAADADKVVVIPAAAADIVLRAAVFEHAASLCLDAVFNVLSERLKLDMTAFRQRHANLE
jgi:6-phospho-3-hexuloisomerase